MRINCFGDSLTAGTAFGNTLSYPEKLSRITGLQVNNYGIGGEDSMTIAARIGALPLSAYVSKCDETGRYNVTLRTQSGKEPGLLKQIQEDTGKDLVNPVTIQGIDGILSRHGDSMCFASEKEFSPITDKADVRTFLSGLDFSEDINIFWAGTNDYASMSNVEQVIDNICAMIDFTGSEKYLVLGLTAMEYMPEISAVNERLFEKFGEHFLDFRTYLLENISTVKDIKLDSEDIRALEKGDIPDCLIKAPEYDHVHGNEKFFDLLGSQVYEKLLQMGYLNS